MTKENFVKFTFALIDYIDHLNKLSDLFDTDAFFGGPSGRFVDTIMEQLRTLPIVEKIDNSPLESEEYFEKGIV